MENYYDEEEMRRLERIQRKQEMRRKQRERELHCRLVKMGLAAACVLVVLVSVFTGKKRQAQEAFEGVLVKKGLQDFADAQIKQRGSESAEEQKPAADGGNESDTGNESDIGKEGRQNYEYVTTQDTLQLGSEITSSHAIFLDTEEKTVLAGKDAFSPIVPASMTKVLTLLVAVEHIDNLEDEFTITQEITDYCFVNDCSNAGFEKGEKVNIKDLLYATVLPSGADAALGLAVYVSGSQEAFMELMNEKLEELGLSESAHFTNCVGIYEEDHYCTIYDMAIIMGAALQNPVCREVLSARTYTTSITKQHPEGILLSNWFIRRIEDKDTGGAAVGGKTGYVEQSGSCAVSFGISEKGKEYICVTANAASKWTCIDDHAYLYHRFLDVS